MKFFFSGEIDAAAHEHWGRIAYAIEKRLNAALAERDYGPAVRSFGLIPMVVRPELRDGWSERRLWSRRRAETDYRTWIALDRYLAASDSEREVLIVRNLLEAVRDVGRKAGKHFPSDQLSADILQVMGMSADALQFGSPAAQRSVAADKREL